MDLNSLKKAIENFLESKAPTITMANEIELLLDEMVDDDFFEETREMLARFRPEGGNLLYKTDTITERLKRTLNYMGNI